MIHESHVIRKERSSFVCVNCYKRTKPGASKDHQLQYRCAGFCNVLSQRISLFRERKGFNVGQLAIEIGSQHPQVLHWEAGLEKPKFDGLVRLAEALDVPMGLLATGEMSFVEYGAFTIYLEWLKQQPQQGDVPKHIELVELYFQIHRGKYPRFRETKDELRPGVSRA